MSKRPPNPICEAIYETQWTPKPSDCVAHKQSRPKARLTLGTEREERNCVIGKKIIFNLLVDANDWEIET